MIRIEPLFYIYYNILYYYNYIWNNEFLLVDLPIMCSVEN